LFDSDRTDEALELEAALHRRIGDHQLLWIDVEGPLDDEVAAGIAKRMELRPTTRRALGQADRAAHLALHGSYFHVRVATEADREPSESPHWLDLVAADNVVLTNHVEPVAFLRDLDDRVEADTNVGGIDASAFVATAIDSAVTSYFKSVDEIEDAVERLDRRALSGREGDDVLADLVALRRRIGRLRRVLSDERDVFAAFRAADFEAVAPGDDSAAFQALSERFESALGSVEQSRDLLIGSFDIFMTRTAQRTNEVMKILALATVLLLPGSLIAGLLGMNVTIPLSADNVAAFWFVVAAIVLLALAVLGFARYRRWI
jgi:Mg2+ and Co2+ transporter CorA